VNLGTEIYRLKHKASHIIHTGSIMELPKVAMTGCKCI